MKINAYIKPEIGIIKISGNVLMDTWSIGVDNDPDHAIIPGEEDDIGAKQGFLDEEDERGWAGRSLWED